MVLGIKLLHEFGNGANPSQIIVGLGESPCLAREKGLGSWG